MTVPAGGSVDVPVDFEGSSRAIVLVIGNNAGSGLSASYPAAAFAVEELLGVPVLVADLNAPSNGTVRLTNTTADTIDAGVIVSPETDRAMAVTASPSLATPGQPVTISASLSSGVPADAPRVQVLDASGAVVADATGAAGSVNLTFTPPHGGAYLVVAEVDGPRPRRATDTFNVSPGGASLTGGFNERTVDENGNGLADALIVGANLNVATPSAYGWPLSLVNASGAQVTATGLRATLGSGSQSVELRFEGREIYDSAASARIAWWISS